MRLRLRQSVCSNSRGSHEPPAAILLFAQPAPRQRTHVPRLATRQRLPFAATEMVGSEESTCSGSESTQARSEGVES